MSPHEMIAVVRAEPFRPFRVHTRDGAVREVRYQHEFMVTWSGVLMPLPVGVDPRTPDRVPLDEIVRLEAIDNGDTLAPRAGWTRGPVEAPTTTSGASGDAR